MASAHDDSSYLSSPAHTYGLYSVGSQQPVRPAAGDLKRKGSLADRRRPVHLSVNDGVACFSDGDTSTYLGLRASMDSVSLISNPSQQAGA